MDKILFEYGFVKNHNYPLRKLMIKFNNKFQFIKSHQWCFAYRMFKIGYFEIYYFDVDQD